MSVGTGTFDPMDGALERELRQWLRSFDPGAASPALRARVGKALAQERTPAGGTWRFGALRGLAGLGAAAGLVVLAGAILAMFAGSRLGVETGAPDPTIVGPDMAGEPSAFWWLPAVAGGAVAGAIAYALWPALCSLARALVPRTAVERPGPAVLPLDRVAQAAIVLLSLATAGIWLIRLVAPGGLGGPGLVFVVAETLPAVIVVPIVLVDASAWRRRPWLVAGALLYPISAGLRIVLPPVVQSTPADGGSSVVALSPSMIAEALWVVAPLVLAIGIGHWLGVGRGPSRLVTVVAIGVLASLEAAEAAAAMLPGASWYVFDTALLAGELALALVGIAIVREHPKSWPARWIAAAGVIGLTAGIVGRAGTLIVYSAGPSPDASLANIINALLPLQGTAAALYALALLLAFLPRPNVHLSLPALRSAGLTPPETGPADDEPSDEPLPRPDR